MLQIESIAKVDAFHASVCFASCDDAPDLAACLATPSDPDMSPPLLNDPGLSGRHTDLFLKIRRERRLRRRRPSQ
jgi:hypothetical protein